MAVQLDEVIVRHTRDIIDDYLVRLDVFVGNAPLVVRLVYIVDMVRKDRGGPVADENVAKQTLVYILHHRLCRDVEPCAGRRALVDQLLVILL